MCGVFVLELVPLNTFLILGFQFLRFPTCLSVHICACTFVFFVFRRMCVWEFVCVCFVEDWTCVLARFCVCELVNVHVSKCLWAFVFFMYV